MRLALTFACCLVCGAASAQTGVGFRYSAPPECPSEQEFRDQVDALLLRDPRAREVAPPNRGAGVSVQVRLEPSERRASLVLEEPGRPPVERSVEGDTCAELASGLELITALAFGAPQESTQAAAPEPPRPPETAPSAPPALVARAPREPALVAAASSPAERDTGAAQKRPSTSPALGWGLGAGGWLNTWSAPHGLLGADAFLRLGPKSPATWSVRIAGLYGFGSSTVEDRRAEFTFAGARLEGCPLAHGLPLKLSAEACLALDLGALHGRGDAASALYEASSSTTFWAAAVIAGRLRAHFAERLSLEAQAELGLPLVRHEFVFDDPQQRIFEVPTVGFGAGIGLAVEIL